MKNTLRSKVIRLAHTNPELRPQLLPLLLGKEAGTPLKFRKNSIGYEVEANGDHYQVVSRDYQSGDKGERTRMKLWSAYDKATKNDVAKATDFKILQTRLSTYITDKDAGSLKSGMSAEAKYGVNPSLKEAAVRSPEPTPKAVADMKKVVRSLIISVENDMKRFINKMPEEVREKLGHVTASVESLPMRGGYGPFETGEINVGGYTIKLVGDVPKFIVGGALYSGPHHLGGSEFNGTPGTVWGSLSKQLETIKADMTRTMKKILAEAVPPEASLPSLRGIKLGPGGSVMSIDDDHKGTWFIEPRNRQRLDHYGNDGEGWDDDGWDEEYAGPVYKAAKTWLDNEYGPGLFEVEVGEKGHVEVSLTSAGKKKFGI